LAPTVRTCFALIVQEALIAQAKDRPGYAFASCALLPSVELPIIRLEGVPVLLKVPYMVQNHAVALPKGRTQAAPYHLKIERPGKRGPKHNDDLHPGNVKAISYQLAAGQPL